MFEQGYHKFWLQNQIRILYPALWVHKGIPQKSMAVQG